MQPVRTTGIFLMLLLSSSMFAQQQNLLSLAEADSLLINRSLILLASHFEVDKADAQIIQTKLFSNPVFSSEWSIYNPSTGRAPDIGPQGQKAFSFEKIFRIAGQRDLSIQLAAEQKQFSIWQYNDLVRALRFQMHTDFFSLYFVHSTADSISSQVTALSGMINAFEEQYAKNNISLKELTRLKTTWFELSNQVTTLRARENELQKELGVLLSIDFTPLAAPTAGELQSVNTITANQQQLIQTALSNRPDLMATESLLKQSQLQLKLEQRAAVPNLAAGALYDQSGSYIRNYYALTLGLEIPIFNRNQGNIKIAEVGIKQAETVLTQNKLNIEREVSSAFQRLVILRNQVQSTGSEFQSQLDELSHSALQNYLKKNISLLEFTDLFEAYNQTILSINDLNISLYNSYEELNYVVGAAVR